MAFGLGGLGRFAGDVGRNLVAQAAGNARAQEARRKEIEALTFDMLRQGFVPQGQAGTAGAQRPQQKAQPFELDIDPANPHVAQSMQRPAPPAPLHTQMMQAAQGQQQGGGIGRSILNALIPQAPQAAPNFVPGEFHPANVAARAREDEQAFTAAQNKIKADAEKEEKAKDRAADKARFDADRAARKDTAKLTRENAILIQAMKSSDDMRIAAQKAAALLAKQQADAKALLAKQKADAKSKALLSPSEIGDIREEILILREGIQTTLRGAATFGQEMLAFGSSINPFSEGDPLTLDSVKKGSDAYKIVRTYQELIKNHENLIAESARANAKAAGVQHNPKPDIEDDLDKADKGKSFFPRRTSAGALKPPLFDFKNLAPGLVHQPHHKRQ